MIASQPSFHHGDKFDAIVDKKILHYLSVFANKTLERSLKPLIKYIKSKFSYDFIGMRLYESMTYSFPLYTNFGGYKSIRYHADEHPDCICNKFLYQQPIDIASEGITANGSYWQSDIENYLDFDSCTGCNLVDLVDETKSIAIIPIQYSSMTIGLFIAKDTRTNYIKPDHVKFLEIVADILGSKILNHPDFIAPNKDQFGTIITRTCSYCRKVRHPHNNEWISLSEYFSLVHNIKKMQFSHGICPDCFKYVDY